ncbi:hypothetical protein ABZX88_35845 [Kitasatospora aureofaciens]|uniref:hypothetical protein n=1 Tax=Kitasatospora aureofaciens TaxID=1894 RepID=UPI0033BD99C0
MKLPELPELPEGPLLSLKQALRDLHLRAGAPSLRKMRDQVYSALPESDRPSHTHIWNLFAQPTLPDRDFMSEVVLHLATRVSGIDAAEEVNRFHDLWAQAAATTDREEEVRAKDLRDLDPELAELWMSMEAEPLTSARRRPTTAFVSHRGATRHLQRSVWGLYVDAGLPSMAKLVADLGYVPNTREVFRRRLPRPEEMSQNQLREVVVYLARQAGYINPYLICESIELLRRASREEEREL